MSAASHRDDQQPSSSRYFSYRYFSAHYYFGDTTARRQISIIFCLRAACSHIALFSPSLQDGEMPGMAIEFCT